MQKSIVLFASLFSMLAPAFAGEPLPEAVQVACKADYEQHCIAHEPESDAARNCMANAFQKLSDPCVTAILDSPLVEEHRKAAEDAAATAQASESHSSSAATAASEESKPSEPQAPKAQIAKTQTYKKEARAERPKRVAKATSAKRVAHASPTKRVAKTRTAHRAGGSKKSVAGYIKRGTSVAKHYVSKYTRFAFSR